MLVQPEAEPQILVHSAGWLQATSSLYSTLAAIPGTTSRKSGRNLR